MTLPHAPPSELFFKEEVKYKHSLITSTKTKAVKKLFLISVYYVKEFKCFPFNPLDEYQAKYTEGFVFMLVVILSFSRRLFVVFLISVRLKILQFIAF